ncbi:hypothetical protein F5Y08DRAFT_175947 [Xylaria arbuscula]|nr:hypothetical protein F5Y08DRAFT_175947 [Xylaria arbuscula]
MRSVYAMCVCVCVCVRLLKSQGQVVKPHRCYSWVCSRMCYDPPHLRHLLPRTRDGRRSRYGPGGTSQACYVQYTTRNAGKYPVYPGINDLLNVKGKGLSGETVKQLTGMGVYTCALRPGGEGGRINNRRRRCDTGKGSYGDPGPFL